MPRVVSHIVTLDCREAIVRRWLRTGDKQATLYSFGSLRDVYPEGPRGLWGVHPDLQPPTPVHVDASVPHCDDLIIPAQAVPV